MLRGAIELDTCNNVQLRGPVNIMHDPATALPYTQGVITEAEANVRKKVYRWTIEARAPLHAGLLAPVIKSSYQSLGFMKGNSPLTRLPC